jgi:hypothetical protein
MMHLSEVILRAVFSLLCLGYILFTLALVLAGVVQWRKGLPLSPDPVTNLAFRESVKTSLSGRVVGLLGLLSLSLAWPLTVRSHRITRTTWNSLPYSTYARVTPRRLW